MQAQLAEHPPFAVYLFFSKCNSNYQARRAIKTGCSVQYFSTAPTYIRSPTSTLSSFCCRSPLPSRRRPLVRCRFFPSKLSAHLLSSLILTSLIDFLGPSFDARCKAMLDGNQVCQRRFRHGQCSLTFAYIPFLQAGCDGTDDNGKFLLR